MKGTLKRYSFKNFDFKKNGQKHWSSPFLQHFENPFVIDKMLVVGFKTKKIRSTRTGCTLSNHVNSLFIRNIDDNGKLSNWMHEIEMYGFEPEFRNAFWEIFKSKSEYAFYDSVQFGIAKEVLDQYDMHAPDSVTCYLNDNKYYWDMRYTTAASRENKRLEARNQILTMQETWYKDENLSAIFDVAMSSSVFKNEKSQAELQEIINGKQREIREINKYLSNASGLEDLWLEKEDKQKLQSELNKLYNLIDK